MPRNLIDSDFQTVIQPIVYLSTEKVRKQLKVSLSTLRRATQLLRETLPAQAFDKGYCEEGYSLQSYGVLKMFFRLRRQSMPPNRAAEYLRSEFLKNLGE